MAETWRVNGLGELCSNDVRTKGYRKCICPSSDLKNVDILMELFQVNEINLAFNVLRNVKWALNLNNLEQVNVSHNQIRNLEPLVQNAPRLKLLKAGHNKIETLPNFDCPVLEELWINANKIPFLQLSRLSQVKSVRRLILRPNPCCKNKSYRPLLVQTLDHLENLDGHHITTEIRQKTPKMDEDKKRIMMRKPPKTVSSSKGNSNHLKYTNISLEQLAYSSPKKKPAKSRIKRKSKNVLPRTSFADIVFHTHFENQADAVIIRSNGTALARWPSKGIAVSVDKSGQGFRLYASYSHGGLCAMFDEFGQGSVNNVSGTTLFTAGPLGGSIILRGKVGRWDENGVVTHESEELQKGAEVVEQKLQREFGFRYNLQSKQFLLFWSCRGVRHVFSCTNNNPPPNFDPNDTLFDPHISPTYAQKRKLSKPRRSYQEELNKLTSSLDDLTSNFLS